MAAWFKGLFGDQNKKPKSPRHRPRLGQSLLAGERLEHRALLSADAAMSHAAMVADTPGNGAPVAIVSSAQPPATLIASRPGEPGDQVLPAVHPPYSSGWQPFAPNTTPLGGQPVPGSVMSNQLPPVPGSSMNANDTAATSTTSGTDAEQPVDGEPTGGYPGPAGVGVYPFPVR